MKLSFSDIKDREKDKTCLVIAHGKSLNNYSQKLTSIKQDNVVLIGCNEWYNFYNTEPQYWTLANNCNSIKSIYEKINTFTSTLVYADSVDLTPRDFVDRILKVDYLPYDQRHVNGYPCNCAGCKHAIEGRLTIQQELCNYTKTYEMYEGGATVVTHSIALAIILGCKEVYFIGIDLNWDQGYAENTENQQPDDAAVRETELCRNMTIDDLIILKKAAEKVGCKIYNCNEESIYNDIEVKVL